MEVLWQTEVSGSGLGAQRRVPDSSPESAASQLRWHFNTLKVDKW